jgi:exopolysaccharide biosynthesis polyprenyl glycosylphosphotransferase
VRRNERQRAAAKQRPKRPAVTTLAKTELLRHLAVVPEQARETYELRTVQILQARETRWRRRGWLVRRALLIADIAALTLAFYCAELLVHHTRGLDRVNLWGEWLFFVASLPVWVVVASLAGLYDRDGERTDHSTADDVVGVFNVVTIGTWLVFATGWVTQVTRPDPSKLVAFWGMAIALVILGRFAARALSRRSTMYLQNTIIVGAGDVGQLIARKILHHPEYGLNLVGFVDDQPKERREDLGDLTLLGHRDELPELVRLLDVERVVLAFSNERDEEKVGLVRKLEKLHVQVDVVPRLFEIVGPKVGIHTLEGLPLVGIPPVQLSRLSRMAKRSIDAVLAALALILTAPLFAYIAWRIRRDSPGPVFFNQTRLGMNMRPFTALKFRTMYVDTDVSEHREYIHATMNPLAPVGANGLYKLDQGEAVTPYGRWLRRTSLDELPQLVNVVRGQMSLVGPRPCIPYETENFAPHQFDRFLVPAGLTGLWQVMARAHSSFGEALDMDVAYARGWSLGLDLRLLCRTPLAVVRHRGTT